MKGPGTAEVAAWSCPEAAELPELEACRAEVGTLREAVAPSPPSRTGQHVGRRVKSCVLHQLEAKECRRLLHYDTSSTVFTAKHHLLLPPSMHL